MATKSSRGQSFKSLSTTFPPCAPVNSVLTSGCAKLPQPTVAREDWAAAWLFLPSVLLKQESSRHPVGREAREGASHQPLEFHRRLAETEAKAAVSRQQEEVYLHSSCHYRLWAVG